MDQYDLHWVIWYWNLTLRRVFIRNEKKDCPLLTLFFVCVIWTFNPHHHWKMLSRRGILNNKNESKITINQNCLSFRSVRLYFCYDMKVILPHQITFCVYYNSLVLNRIIKIYFFLFTSLQIKYEIRTMALWLKIFFLLPFKYQKNVVKEMCFSLTSSPDTLLPDSMQRNQLMMDLDVVFVTYKNIFRKLINHWMYFVIKKPIMMNYPSRWALITLSFVDLCDL